MCSNINGFLFCHMWTHFAYVVLGMSAVKIVLFSLNIALSLQLPDTLDKASIYYNFFRFLT